MNNLEKEIQAEYSVLGALLIDNDAIDRIADLLPEHFYNHENRQYFEELQKQIIAGKRADVITIFDSLRGKIPDCLQTLNMIANSVGSSANVQRYADIIIDKAIKRALVAIMREGEEVATSFKKSAECVDLVASKLEKLAQRRTEQEPQRLETLLGDYAQTLEDRMSGKIKPIKTGYVDLDFKLGGGLERGTLTVVAGRPAMGKELTLDAKVLLSNGLFKTMGEMAMGDKVASIDGRDSFVIGVFPQGIKPVYEITFSDGRKVKSGLDHQWEINFRKWSEPKILTTKELIEKIKMPQYKKRLSIPYASGDFGFDENIVVDPYLLGAIIGDGNLTQSSIRYSTSYEYMKDKIISLIGECDFVKSSKNDYRISKSNRSNNELLQSLKNLGLMGKYSHEKFIPEQYLSASREVRIKLMQGLIDTDGTVEKTGAMTYTTTSELLAKQVQMLARSLGAYASMSSRSTQYTHKGEKKNGRKSYTIYISSKNYDEFVTIPHKKERIKKTKSSRLLNIESIEYIGEFECQCIAVSHDRSLYLTNDYAVTHNTAFGLGVARNVSFEGSALFLSMEMPKEQVCDRNIAALGQIPIQWLRNPGDSPPTKDYWDQMAKAFGQTQDMNLFIDDQTALNMMSIRNKSRKVKRLSGLDLLVIDQLSFIAGATSDKLHEAIGEHTRGLLAIAKEMKIAVILLCQLNRDCEKRPDKRPMMSDLANSGSIEQDANNILFLYRDEVYNDDSRDKGVCEVIIGKQRQGSPGFVGLKYFGEQTRFEDLERGWQPSQPKSARRKGLAADL